MVTSLVKSVYYLTFSQPPGDLTRSPLRGMVKPQAASKPWHSGRLHEIYSYSMQCRGHGYAPYAPEPPDSLPPAYRHDGVNICDVLLLDSHGGYNYLFNCSLPGDHPKNAQGVPPLYTPFEIRPHNCRTYTLYHRPGKPISSSGSEETRVRASTPRGPPTEYVSYASRSILGFLIIFIAPGELRLRLHQEQLLIPHIPL
jgi:hypothetical protein